MPADDDDDDNADGNDYVVDETFNNFHITWCKHKWRDWQQKASVTTASYKKNQPCIAYLLPSTTTFFKQQFKFVREWLRGCEYLANTQHILIISRKQRNKLTKIQQQWHSLKYPYNMWKWSLVGCSFVLFAKAFNMKENVVC